MFCTAVLTLVLHIIFPPKTSLSSSDMAIKPGDVFRFLTATMPTRCGKKANRGDMTRVVARKGVKNNPAKSPAVGIMPSPHITTNNSGGHQEEEMHAPNIMESVLDVFSN